MVAKIYSPILFHYLRLKASQTSSKDYICFYTRRIIHKLTGDIKCLIIVGIIFSWSYQIICSVAIVSFQSCIAFPIAMGNMCIQCGWCCMCQSCICNDSQTNSNGQLRSFQILRDPYFKLFQNYSNINRPVLFPADCPQSIIESSFWAFFIDFALPTFIFASKPKV